VVQPDHHSRVGAGGAADGGIEALGLLGGQLALTGPFWTAVGSLNNSLGYLGFAVVGIFVLCWIGSTAVYRRQGYDQVEITKTR